MPPIMNIIISGQASANAPYSRVLAGTPRATRPTTRMAAAIAYNGSCWRFMASPFPKDTFHAARGYRAGVWAKVALVGVEGPYPAGVCAGTVEMQAPRGVRHDRHRCCRRDRRRRGGR